MLGVLLERLCAETRKMHVLYILIFMLSHILYLLDVSIGHACSDVTWPNNR